MFERFGPLLFWLGTGAFLLGLVLFLITLRAQLWERRFDRFAGAIAVMGAGVFFWLLWAGVLP